MNAPANITLWHQSDEAQAILDRLTADDVCLVTETPLFGDRYFRWAAPDFSDELDRVRRAAIDEAYGTPWADLPDTEARRDYVAFDRSQPSVADVLADLFGAPDSLGSPPQWMIHGDGIDANMRGRARELAKLAKGHRAYVRGGGGMSLQTAIERLEKSLWDTRTLPVRADIRTLLDAYYEATGGCCDNGKVWNNAEPTSGQWVPCERHGGEA